MSDQLTTRKFYIFQVKTKFVEELSCVFDFLFSLSKIEKHAFEAYKLVSKVDSTQGSIGQKEYLADSCKRQNQAVSCKSWWWVPLCA